MKQHLLGGYRNATCKQCLVHVKEEIKVYKSKKKEVKEQRNLPKMQLSLKPITSEPCGIIYSLQNYILNCLACQ